MVAIMRNASALRSLYRTQIRARQGFASPLRAHDSANSTPSATLTSHTKSLWAYFRAYAEVRPTFDLDRNLATVEKEALSLTSAERAQAVQLSAAIIARNGYTQYRRLPK
jgi:hypothetical protein